MCHRKRHRYIHHLEIVGTRSRREGYGNLERAGRKWNVQQYPGDRGRIRRRGWRISGRVDCRNGYFDDHDDYAHHYSDDWCVFTDIRYTTGYWMGVRLTTST